MDKREEIVIWLQLNDVSENVIKEILKCYEGEIQNE